MKILIDTNVILDTLLNREPHCQHSRAILKLCNDSVIGCFTMPQCSDIFYLLRRSGVSAVDAKSAVISIANQLQVLDSTARDLHNALAADMPDFEDALLAFCAKRHAINYIITRNAKDFRLSPVEAISPQQFIEK